jgi:hypothetical protein
MPPQGTFQHSQTLLHTEIMRRPFDISRRSSEATRRTTSLGLIYEEAGAWSEAILAPRTSTGLDICLPATYVHLTRALYPRHGREMNLGLPQSPSGACKWSYVLPWMTRIIRQSAKEAYCTPCLRPGVQRPLRKNGGSALSSSPTPCYPGLRAASAPCSRGGQARGASGTRASVAPAAAPSLAARTSALHRADLPGARPPLYM